MAYVRAPLLSSKHGHSLLYWCSAWYSFEFAAICFSQRELNPGHIFLFPKHVQNEGYIHNTMQTIEYLKIRLPGLHYDVLGDWLVANEWT